MAPSMLDNVCGESDTLIHCAASTYFANIRSVWDTNISGLDEVLRLAKGMRRLRQVVYYGSAAATGAHPNEMIDETVP